MQVRKTTMHFRRWPKDVTFSQASGRCRILSSVLSIWSAFGLRSRKLTERGSVAISVICCPRFRLFLVSRKDEQGLWKASNCWKILRALSLFCLSFATVQWRNLQSVQSSLNRQLSFFNPLLQYLITFPVFLWARERFLLDTWAKRIFAKLLLFRDLKSIYFFWLCHLCCCSVSHLEQTFWGWEGWVGPCQLAAKGFSAGFLFFLLPDLKFANFQGWRQSGFHLFSFEGFRFLP